MSLTVTRCFQRIVAPPPAADSFSQSSDRRLQPPLASHALSPAKPLVVTTVFAGTAAQAKDLRFVLSDGDTAVRSWPVSVPSPPKSGLSNLELTLRRP